MSLITRQPTANQTNDATQGGSAFDSISNTGGFSSMSVSDSPGGSNALQFDSARWFGLEAVAGQIAEIRVKFDWGIGGTLDVEVTEDGTADASYNYNIDISSDGGSSWAAGGVAGGDGINVGGPGPVSDHLDISEGGSVNQVISNSVPVNNIQVRAGLNGSADAGIGTGSANASPSISVSNIRVEVTTVDGHLVVMM